MKASVLLPIAVVLTLCWTGASMAAPFYGATTEISHPRHYLSLGYIVSESGAHGLPFSASAGVGLGERAVIQVTWIHRTYDDDLFRKDDTRIRQNVFLVTPAAKFYGGSRFRSCFSLLGLGFGVSRLVEPSETYNTPIGTDHWYLVFPLASLSFDYKVAGPLWVSAAIVAAVTQDTFRSEIGKPVLEQRLWGKDPHCVAFSLSVAL